MAVEKIDIDQTDEWLAHRREVVTATDVATVLGLGAWGSLAELYAEKKGLRPPREDSATLRQGRWREASVFEALADERPHWDVVRAKIFLVDRERHLGATPDGFALRPDRPGRGIVQAKSIARSIFRRKWLLSEEDDVEHGAAEVPVYYRLQTLTEMMLSDCQWGVVAVIINTEFTTKLRVFDIERNDESEKLIVDGVAHFKTHHLDANIMPEFVPQQDAELIRALYRTDDGSVVNLAGDNFIGLAVETWQHLQAEKARVEGGIKAAKADIENIMREHTYAVLADGRVLQWKIEPRKAYSVGPSNPRVLRLKQKLPAHLLADDAEEEDISDKKIADALFTEGRNE